MSKLCGLHVSHMSHRKGFLWLLTAHGLDSESLASCCLTCFSISVLIVLLRFNAITLVYLRKDSFVPLSVSPQRGSLQTNTEHLVQERIKIHDFMPGESAFLEAQIQ